LLKFVQVRPDLRDALWTLDEDGEVSGTVMLMLGSLMMKEALYTPPQVQQAPLSSAPQMISVTSPLYIDHRKHSALISNNNTILQLTTTASVANLPPQPPIVITSHQQNISNSTSPIFSATNTPARTVFGNTTNTKSANIVSSKSEQDKEEPCDTS